MTTGTLSTTVGSIVCAVCPACRLPQQNAALVANVAQLCSFPSVCGYSDKALTVTGMEDDVVVPSPN